MNANEEIIHLYKNLLDDRKDLILKRVQPYIERWR